MARKRTFTMPFEVERRNGTVEYEVEYEVSPGEPERGPTYDCGGTPAYPPEVESKTVYFVCKKRCPGCKGVGLVDFEHLDGTKTPRLCPKCHGTKRVSVREERPELEGLVDDDELLEHAGEQGDYDGPDTTAEARGER